MFLSFSISKFISLRWVVLEILALTCRGRGRGYSGAQVAVGYGAGV
jgi:hypothetical protein